jgi:hypothetical protein
MYQLAPIKISLQWFPSKNLVQVPYDNITVKHDVPHSIGGVYVLYQHFFNNWCQPFYVGESNDLRSRLLDHLADSEENHGIRKTVKYSCGFKYALIWNPTKDKLRAAESAIYYAASNPSGSFPCNDQTKLAPYNPEYIFDIGL